ncbi:MAG: regulatory protein LuxR [Steroidobacteraceae bacterium]|nr:regulatory protein LuxR [Steroidobacteraceae bacterium]
MHAEAATRHGRVFVGRSRERAALASALDAACGGRGTLCLVSGEPGIGKSRLLAEFATLPSQAGVPIHWGFAWEAGGAPAYWTWIQVLRSILGQDCGRAALAQHPHLMTPIGELVPELVPEASLLPARLEPEQARFRLMDAVSTLLVCASAHSPLVLVLEDLHATDADSLALLEFVMRQLHGSRALVIGTFRDAEIQRPRIGNIIARLRRGSIQLGLRRLDRDEVREYVTSCTGARPLEQQLTEFVTLTEGHPLYLAEVVELYQARGSLRRAPASMRMAILERAADLPPATRELLGMASVLGRSFHPAVLAKSAGCAADELHERLQPALASRLIEQDSSGSLRFEHMLVREAFHESLSPAERRALHQQEAQRMQARADPQAVLPWAALAQHLEESGDGARPEAVAAWRRAAQEAEARHAFDDAAVCLSRALTLLGDQDAAASRGRLLLDLAAVQIRAGDLDAGRRNSTEAFHIGEAGNDAELLADAALTYGNIFTFGKVDARLVKLLQSALARMPARDTDRRARLQARLAGAMQPAADPAEPAALAREAIRIARSNGQPDTLLKTLRSAISALMDLGDPVERLALNQEYVRLARQLGDVPECMRGYMRSAVDAMELADAATLDDAIEQCESVAGQLRLPHYQWTAASLVAMRATTRGDFPQAHAALARARKFAEHAQDTNASLTLLVQQFELAEITCDRDRLADLYTQLERQCANLPQSDLYLKPNLLATGVVALGRAPDPGAIDEKYLRDIVRFSDMGALSSVGEYLVAMRDERLARLAHDWIAPYRDRCGHWGMMGLRWMGPVARGLGHLAAFLGATQAAHEYFESALQTARRMGARPWLARIAVEWVEALRKAGDEPPRSAQLLDEARAIASELRLGELGERVRTCELGQALEKTEAPSESSAGLPAVDYFRLSRDGEVWVCACEGREFRLRDSRGMQMLSQLMSMPGREIHVLDLAGPSEEGEVVDSGDCGELLDERARRDYRQRVESLRAEIEDAESRHDSAAAEAAREELEVLSTELSRAFGLGGRARRAGSNVERARVNVQRRLKHAIDRIARECPAAGRHLEWAVHTGSFCSYQPG